MAAVPLAKLLWAHSGGSPAEPIRHPVDWLMPLCFLGTSATLWLRRPPAENARAPVAATLLPAAILIVSTLLVISSAAGPILCPSGLCWWNRIEPGAAVPGRMSPIAALYFVLISIALLAFDRKPWPGFLHPNLIVSPILCFCLAGLIGSVYGASGYRLGQYDPLSLGATLAFVLTSLAIVFSRPDQGIFRLLPKGSPGARSFNRLLPASILIPIVAGEVAIVGVTHGWFPTLESAGVVVVTCGGLALAFSILMNAIALNRQDNLRARAEADQQRAIYELKTGNQALQIELAERKRLEEKATHDATHDVLTGLPNRMLFVDRLRHSISWTTRHKKMFALFYIDVDNFKPVNDQYGHPAGDMLLKALAIRIRATMREVDTVARLGGDEFAAIMDAPVNGQHALLLARRMSEAICQPYPVNVPELERPIDVYVGVSIGIALFPIHAGNLESLVREADNAMFRAKTDGKTRGKTSANIRLAVTRNEPAL